MKYLLQFALILSITALGELLYFLLPLPIPASIYGLLLLFFLLSTDILSLDKVEDSGRFLLDIMPVMFIPPAVGLLSSWDALTPVLLPFLFIVLSSTIIVLVVSGKITQLMMPKGAKK